MPSILRNQFSAAPLMAKTPCELEDFLNVSPPACISNWHFSGNRHCNILQHYSLLIASDASAFPNQTWHHRCMTLFDSMLVPLLWLLVLLVDGVGSNLPRSFLHWQRDPVSHNHPRLGTLGRTTKSAMEIKPSYVFFGILMFLAVLSQPTSIN